jgi:hypothetical protein
MLDSGRCVKTASGSAGEPGVAGKVIARLVWAAGAAVLEGRTAW